MHSCGRSERCPGRWRVSTLVILVWVVAFSVAVVGCGSSDGTSSTRTASTAPAPAPANASPYLTRAGFTALRDTVALGNARDAAPTSPSAVVAAISKLRKRCPHLGYNPANPQVHALRAECEA